MGGVLSSGLVAIRSKHQVQRSSSSTAVHPDWPGLPEDLLLIVMGALDVPSLVRSGSVCSPWRAAYSTFRRLRLPSPRQLPCLLYAREDYGPHYAAMYSPATGETFRVPLPGPPHHRRGFTVSTAAPGWVFTTDRVGDPCLLNPLTGARAPLPPVRTLHNNDTFLDDDGEHVFPAVPEQGDMEPGVFRARDHSFNRVAVSTGGGHGHGAGAPPTVLAVHPPEWRLSFARVGDERWTPLTGVGPLVGRGALFFGDIVYSEKDALFYAADSDGSVYAVDLDRPSPMVTRIFVGKPRATGCCHTMYLAVAPSGDLVFVDRIWNWTSYPVEDHTTCHEYRYADALLDSDDITTSEDDNGGEEELGERDDEEEELSSLDSSDDEDDDEDEELSSLDSSDDEDDDEDDELYTDSSGDEDDKDEELDEQGKHSGDNILDPTKEILSTYQNNEVTTTELVMHKVDLQRQKLVRLSGIGDDHALFLGYNSPVFLPTKGFPAFKPNHAYLTDNCEDGPALRRDLGVWSFKERRLEQKLSDEWPRVHDWQDLPAPFWMVPSLY